MIEIQQQETFNSEIARPDTHYNRKRGKNTFSPTKKDPNGNFNYEGTILQNYLINYQNLQNKYQQEQLCYFQNKLQLKKEVFNQINQSDQDHYSSSGELKKINKTNKFSKKNREQSSQLQRKIFDKYHITKKKNNKFSFQIKVINIHNHQHFNNKQINKQKSKRIHSESLNKQHAQNLIYINTFVKNIQNKQLPKIKRISVTDFYRQVRDKNRKKIGKTKISEQKYKYFRKREIFDNICNRNKRVFTPNWNYQKMGKVKIS